MKKLYVLPFAVFPAWAQEMPARWHELNKLVRAEVEMLENARKKGDEVHYRLLELYSERMKLTLEKENKAFLEAKGADKHSRKESFFRESLRQYGETRRYGEKFLASYPESRRRGAAFYTLGLNSRDFGRDKRTETYMLKAMELIRPGSDLRHHAETSLADHYYNEKRFQDAIPYYERVVKNDADEWLPKHLLNLGWCQMKTGRHDPAIASLKHAYKLGGSGKYVDIREQVLQHLAPFFVFGDRVADGREFYVKNEKDPVPHLLNLAKRAADKGQGKETVEILKVAQEQIDKNSTPQHQEDLVLYELDFHRSYKRWDEHLQSGHKLLTLFKRAAAPESAGLVKQRDEGVEKVRSVAGFLQLKTAQDMKKNASEYSARDLKRTEDYFTLLRQLDPVRKDEYAYFTGETQYAVGKYPEAAASYRLALEDSKVAPVPERQRKVLNSLLHLAAEEHLTKDKNRELTAYAYENHVSIFPKDPTSHQIYPKLFQLHREEKRDQLAVDALERWNTHYPGDLARQQEMMKALVDDSIKAKDVAKITHWIGEFKRGFLKLDPGTIEQTEIILGQILFVTAEEQVKRGERAAALRTFEEVYKTTLYPSKVRALAAVQAGELELAMARPLEALPWLEKSLELFSPKELAEKTGALTTLFERMAYMREFRGAVRLTDVLLAKTCATKGAGQDRLWEMSVGFHLVLGDDALVRREWKSQQRCAGGAETARKLASRLLHWYHEQNDASRMADFHDEHKAVVDRDDYVALMLELYWDRPLEDQREVRQELMGFKDHPRVSGLMDEFRRQETLAQRQKVLLDTSLLEEKGEFDPEKFNPRLEGLLVELKKLGEEVKPLLSSEHVRLREQAQQQLQSFYGQVSDKLLALAPSHPDEAFVASFRGEMRKIAQVFQAKAVDFKRAARRPSGDVTYLSPVQAPLTSVPMDRFPGGRP